MKTIHLILKIVLSLIISIPIFGSLGIFPPPTADMYTSSEAFMFIEAIMNSGYITIMMSVVFLLALVCIWTKRTALASLLLLPVSLNIVAFHAVLDGGLFTGGAVMGNILLLINIYMIWYSKEQLSFLLKRSR